MSNEFYEGIRQRSLANRKPENTSSLALGNQNQPAPRNAGSSSGYNPERVKPYNHIFEKYFRPEDVDKAKWVSFWENPNQVPVSSLGPNPPQGRATGLMQILPKYTNENGVIVNGNRPTQEELKDPETNIRFAAELVYGPGGKDNGRPANFSDWQDNYDPTSGLPVWGALAAHPYIGDANAPVRPPTPPDFTEEKNNAKTTASAISSARAVQEENFSVWQVDMGRRKDAEIADAKRRASSMTIADIQKEGLEEKGRSIPESKRIMERRLITAINERYDDERRTEEQKLFQLKDQEQNANNYALVLNHLDEMVADKDTNIKSVDDLEKFISETPSTMGGLLPPAWLGKQAIKFNPQQRAYLDNAIKHLAPFLNGPGQQPGDEQALMEFLAATAPSGNIPSHRVSIASLSSTQIKSLLTTAPRQKVQLPPGITREKIAAYLSSYNLLDEDSKKAIGQIQGKSKDLVRRWKDMDASYEAYKLGTIDPSNQLPSFKERDANIFQWTMERYSDFYDKIVRPATVKGILLLDDIGLGSALDLRDKLGIGIQGMEIPYPKFNGFTSLPSITSYEVPQKRAFSSQNLDQLASVVEANKKKGQSDWEAAGNAFDEWDSSALSKFLVEALVDPLNYVGVGIFPKVLRPIGLGKFAEALETGWKLTFENPVVSKLIETGTGAAIGYSVTGGEEYGALIGAGIPSLRYVPLYTSSQAKTKAIRTANGLILDAQMSYHSNPRELGLLSTEDYRKTIQVGLENFKANPQTAHLTREAGMVKYLIDNFDPFITADDLNRMLVPAAPIDRELAGRAARGTSVPSVPDVAVRKAIDVSPQQAVDINNLIDKTFRSETKGAIPLDAAVDGIRTILDLPESAFKPIRDSLLTRWDDVTNRILKAADGATAGDAHVNLLKTVEKQALDGYNNPIGKWAEFQGFVHGLDRKVHPMTRSKVYQFLSNAQNWHSQGMLKFANFGPFNFAETYGKAAVSGAGFGIPLGGNTIDVVKAQYGNHYAFPSSLREGGRGQMDFTRPKKGVTNIDTLQKKKGKMRGLWDFAMGKSLEDKAKEVQAAAFPKFFWNDFGSRNPEYYPLLKEAADSAGIKLHNLKELDPGLASFYIDDMKARSIFRNGAERIRQLKTDMDTASLIKFENEVKEATTKYPTIDGEVVNTILHDVQAGRLTPNLVDGAFDDYLDLIYDMPAVKAELAQKTLVEMREGLEKAIASANTPEEYLQHMKNVIETLEASSDVSSEIYRTATVRGHKIKGDEAKQKHWDLANASLYNYLDVSTAEFPKMIDALRNHTAQFFPDQVTEMNMLLDNMVDRQKLWADWRRSDNAFFSDYIAEHGHFPRGQDLDSILYQKEKNFDEYAAREGSLIQTHQVFARKITPTNGILNDVSTTGLTLPDVAQLMQSSGDEMAQSLVQLDSLQGRTKWVASVYGEVQAKLPEGRTPEMLGWSKEAITNVYNNLRVRMGTDPAEDSVLYVARQEMNSLRQDIHMSHLNRGYSPETINTFNNIIEEYAQKIDKIQYNKIEYPDLTPEFIEPRNTGIGLKSRYSSDTQHVLSRTRLFDVNNTTLEVRRQNENVYELSISRDTAFQNKTRTETYLGRASGSDLESLVEVGQIIDDLQLNNPQATFIAHPTDERRKRIYIKAGFKEQGDNLVLDKLNLPRPAPVAIPGENIKTLRAENEDFFSQVDKSMENARHKQEHVFTDYTNENIFDAWMRNVFPFWFYQTSRWPFLVTTALQHPGLFTTFGRYQDASENGYLHIPGVDLAVNITKGTILNGITGVLHDQFPGRYEDSIYGDLAKGMDQLGAAGFYPGILAQLPLAGAGVRELDVLPTPVESMINLTNYAGFSLPADIRDKYFPSKFREYFTTELSSKLLQERNMGISGIQLRQRINDGEATDEEKAVWRESQRLMAGYSILFDQTGVLKLDIEAKKEANKEISQYIYEQTGITPEQQDVISDRLGNSGYRILDLFPLDPVAAKKMYEMTKYKYWTGAAQILNPPEFTKLQEKINNFWDAVEGINKQAKEQGFTDRNGKKQPSLNQLDEQFKSGAISARDYLKAVAGVKSERAIAIKTLKEDKNYKDVPITLEQREEYRRTHNMPMPVEHPAKELINYYNEIPLEEDKAGEPMWDKYFASLDGLLQALPEKERNYLLDYVQRDWTDTQKLYWTTNNNFIRPYMNLREGLLRNVQQDQQSFLRKYEDATPAMIKNLSEEEQKLVTDFNSALSRSRERYRQLDPEVDAWLFYWGKVSTVQSEAARLKYNEIVKKNGGGVPLTKPIDETKKKILPALP